MERRIKNILLLLFVLVCRAFPQQHTDIAETLRRYEDMIVRQIEEKAIQESYKSIARYSTTLMDLYDPPLLRDGTYTCHAEHIRFQSPFPGWKEVGFDELELLADLNPLGIQTCLALQSSTGPEEVLLFFTYNMGRSGTFRDFSDTGLLDKTHRVGAHMLSSNFGEIRRQEFQAIGDHRVLLTEIPESQYGVPVCVASLVNGHTLCFFILAGPEHSFRVNRKRLYRLIETVEFQFRSAEKQKIRSILDETGSVSGTGVRGRLRGVRLLALAGEYNAAVDELMVLRRELAAGLSNPVIEGNHLHYPLYNIHLTNPDEDRFTFHITDLPEMSSHMLFLQNKESGEGMGMGVVVLDMVLNYGPGYVKYIGDKTTEVDFLKAWGRSFIIGMNAGIEGERFVRIKKDRMYRAVFSTAMPDVKGKLYAVMRSGYLVGILILERTDRFGARTAIYEKMLGGNGLIIGE